MPHRGALVRALVVARGERRGRARVVGSLSARRPPRPSCRLWALRPDAGDARYAVTKLRPHPPRTRDLQCAIPGSLREAAKQPFILTAGRFWDEAKNTVILERVAGGLQWPVLAAGDRGPLGLGERGGGAIGYLGPLSPGILSNYLATASIYVLPSRYEPFGLSALEAAMCGCALVLGDIPSLREVWKDTAIFVAPDDRAGLREALRGLIESASRRAEWASRARERACFFTPEKMASEYCDLYGHLLAGGAGG